MMKYITRCIILIFCCPVQALKITKEDPANLSKQEICGLSALLTGQKDIETSHAADHCQDHRTSFEMTDSQFSQRKKALWIHLHNFGGTFMCQEAVRQGEITAPSNCNVPGDSCSQEANLIHCDQRGQYTFSSIERSVKDDDVSCSDTIYGVMLRDPISGMRSTMVANSFSNQKMFIIEALRNKQAVNSFANNAHPCLPSGDNYQHFDNFMTRSLSGNYNSPPGQVRSEDLEKAKARLRQMNVILIMEELSDHLPQLRSTFKWDLTNAPAEANTHRNKWLEQAFTPQEEELLKNNSNFDYELYEYGKQLARQLTAAAVEP